MDVFDGLSRFKTTPTKKADATLAVINEADKKSLKRFFQQHLQSWQHKNWEKNSTPLSRFDGKSGPVWLVLQQPVSVQQDAVGASSFALMRDMVGVAVNGCMRDPGLKKLAVNTSGISSEALRGLLVGIGISQYRYAKSRPDFDVHLHSDEKVSKAMIQEASDLCSAVNFARRLVDLPPNELNPRTYAAGLKKVFADFENTKIEVWTDKRLKKENMGLLLGVGQAAAEPPCMVHISYRPHSKKRPIAFVGKGITFDSGGLDIKPAGPMRLMKKDMGGSAAVAGLAYYMCSQKVQQPADFYFALAENAISSSAFRPGDVLQSRSGKTVEIHNTDAEGRLVMADAIDVAVTRKGKDAPEILVDVATLTGAIKAGLGTDIGGLFSNRDELACELQSAAESSGDPLWKMPLYQGYRGKLNSPVADLVNAADGFGGAITAALFLQSFVRNTPWIHLDIYAWNDKPQGSFNGTGGSGQGVQALAEWIRNRNDSGETDG